MSVSRTSIVKPLFSAIICNRSFIASSSSPRRSFFRYLQQKTMWYLRRYLLCDDVWYSFAIFQFSCVSIWKVSSGNGTSTTPIPTRVGTSNTKKPCSRSTTGQSAVERNDASRPRRLAEGRFSPLGWLPAGRRRRENDVAVSVPFTPHIIHVVARFQGGFGF